MNNLKLKKGFLILKSKITFKREGVVIDANKEVEFTQDPKGRFYAKNENDSVGVFVNRSLIGGLRFTK